MKGYDYTSPFSYSIIPVKLARIKKIIACGYETF
uniref:Uncharacterized protein n=1 Tax=Arundo donax TaxID=35708 RepID=A0A0A9B3L8_ARUDO